MSLCIYNTLARKKQKFTPLESGRVKMYVCGPTVYANCHLGHGRAYVAFDVIYRYLKYKGYSVTYVRNVTDIDDKIIKRANEMDLPEASLKEKVSVLTKKYLEGFHNDMESLGLSSPTNEPSATEYIPQMIELIEKLIKNGFAYVVGADVFYEVSKFSEYGRLSGRSLDELVIGARVEPLPGKRAPLDFSLWKEAKPQEPFWESPWGKGRPGWHIECSSMSLSLLGEVFDIHGGGQDLIFPHHENEIAQSCGCTGKRPVCYWVHNGFVTINKEKMSKSLGNFFTLKEIFQKYRPEIVRFFLLAQHYRSPIDFSDTLLKDASFALERIIDCIQRSGVYLGGRQLKEDLRVKDSLMAKFSGVMDDDFNTAQALALVFDIVKDVNNDLNNNNDPEKIFTKVNAVEKILEVMGIKYSLPSIWRVNIGDEVEVNEKELERLLGSEKVDRNTVIDLIKKRHYCRRTKRWRLSDMIRDFLLTRGYSLRDTAGVTECIKKKL